MCRPASMIATLGHKMTWSPTKDSHSDIRAEFGMPENGIGRINSVQIEITPPNGDYSLPPTQWTFCVDQDTLPDWWDAEEAEKQCRIALEAWAKVRLVRSGEVRTLNDGEHVTALCGGTLSKMCGGTLSKMSGGTLSEMCGGTLSKMSGGTLSYMSGGTLSKMFGGTLSYMSGGTLSKMFGGALSEMSGGTASFNRHFECKLIGQMSVIIDRSGTKARCIVGTEKMRTVRATKRK